MKKVRWGVIGCGGIARTRTIPGMLLTENAQLVSVMARDLASAQAVQEQFGRMILRSNCSKMTSWTRCISPRPSLRIRS